MDKHKALEILDEMIKTEKASADPLKALRDRIISLQNDHAQPLRKAISEVEGALKKSSAVDLDMSEKVKKATPAPAPMMPKTPTMPKQATKVPTMHTPGMPAPKIAKIDPTTHLRGTLLDKNLSPGMQGGDMGSSNQTMTPEMIKAAPSDAPPMMASEGKSHMHKHIAKCLGKCMKKTLAASEEKGVHSPIKEKGGQSKAGAMPKPKLTRSEANPDEKQDAKLGEGVEHLVEDHMMANKPAEMKEGHKIFKADHPVSAIIQHLHSKKMMKSSTESNQNAEEMGSEAKRAIEEPKDKPMKIQPNRPGQANKPVEKAEVLNKPYKSKAQQGWAHTPAGKKALGGEVVVHEWDEASKGKKLPKKAPKK